MNPDPEPDPNLSTQERRRAYAAEKRWETAQADAIRLSQQIISAIADPPLERRDIVYVLRQTAADLNKLAQRIENESKYA